MISTSPAGIRVGPIQKDLLPPGNRRLHARATAPFLRFPLMETV